MAQENRTVRPEERPEHTPERNVEAAVRGTFPASDPVSTTASQGARAVPPERMMPAGGDAAPRRPDDAVTLRREFPDAEAAKLALETLVREGPVDRRCAELDGAALALHVPGADAARLDALLQRQAGGR